MLKFILRLIRPSHRVIHDRAVSMFSIASKKLEKANTLINADIDSTAKRIDKLKAKARDLDSLKQTNEKVQSKLKEFLV